MIWRVDTKAEFGVVQNFFGVASAPVVSGDLLIVQVGGSPPGAGNFPIPEQKSNGSAVVAFDKLTGKVRYRLGDDLASFSSPVLATIGGREWCFVLARGGLLGFEPRTGRLDFHYPWRAKDLESANAASPVVINDRVFISEAYGPGSSLLQVRPGRVEVVWSDADKGRRKAMQAHWVTPIHVGGYLYGDSSRHSADADLRCVELASGKIMWREPDNGHTSLLWVDDHFVGLTEYGELLLITVNSAKYQEVCRFQLFRLAAGADIDLRTAARQEYPWWAAPVLSHGLLYVRGASTLLCLELIPDRHEAR
jgi:outer membrane protein assembly factor BamB